MENQIPGVVQGSDVKNYYWSIFDGKFARKATSESETGAVTRTNKKGVKVHEVFANYGLKGTIRDVNIFENTWDGKKVKQLVIKLIPSPGIAHILNIPKESRYFGNFLEKLNNLNLKHEVEIAPYNFEDENTKKKNQGVSLKQDGIKINSHYKVKNNDKYEFLHGYPPFPGKWNELSDREKTNYWFDVDEFLEKVVREWRAKNAPDYQKEKDDAWMNTPPMDADLSDMAAQAEKALTEKDDLPF